MEANRVKHLLDLKGEREWHDWRFQLRNSPRSIPDLLEMIPDLKKTLKNSRSFETTSEIIHAAEIYRFAATPYYISLLNPENPYDPILKQLLPDGRELSDPVFTSPDPLHEEKYSPMPGLIHRYPDRVLLYTTDRCAVYCRYCTRKRKILEEDPAVDIEPALEYIRTHTGILEVILSGGDPLFLSDGALETILKQLRKIKHLISIRIHTRMPVVLPMRITDRLLAIFEKYDPITMVTHFNHANEITDDTAQYVKRLRKSGVIMLNQTVLLKDVNDTTECMEELFLNLLKIGIKPYYLHQCDEVKGVSHFQTSVETGKNIMQELWGRIPGIAVPRYVIDLPEGGGKHPVEFPIIL